MVEHVPDDRQPAAAGEGKHVDEREGAIIVLDYEPGASETGQAPTTGAHAGRATGKTEEREALKL